MRRIGTIIKYLVLLLILLVALIGLGVVYTLRSPFPQTDGALTVSGLQDSVTVKRDELGVAHIYAENTHDLFFAQGYTHAQDRFWQMEFWRHIGMGRLSEIVGPPTLETDKFIRNMGWNRLAVNSAENYRVNSPELWTILEAYSAGVNAWIADNGDNISFNQTVLNLSAGEWEIEPWEPVHTVAWGVVMAWDLRGSSNLNSEQSWAELQEALGPELLEQIMPAYPANRPVIVPSSAETHTPTPANAEPAEAATDQPINLSQFTFVGSEPPNGFALGSGPQLGSNNWVVAGQHTDTGQPLLADDPHVGVQMPSIWYWNGLHAPGWDVAGMSFAGVPGVIIGHNDRIAWGVTNMTADSQDVYIEKLNPDNPRQYEVNGEWQDMVLIKEEIKVNGGETVVLDVYETVHGPLLNTLDEELEQALTARWTAATPSRIFQSVIELNQAQDYEGFRDALSKWDSSPQNIVYADVDGNIAYQSTGLYPVRRGWEGTQPVAGWTGEFEWDGFIPYDEMPRLFNPPEGFIVTANNAIVDAQFPYYLARDWASGDRAQRITDMLEAQIETGGEVSAEIFQQIQNDNYELLLDSYRPLLATLDTQSELEQEALGLILDWDGQLAIDSTGATAFEVFLWQLAESAIADEIGGATDVSNGSRTRIFLHALAADLDSQLWDNITTSKTETPDDIMRLALEQTTVYLVKTMGGIPSNWVWGDLHHITFSSNPLGESGIGQLEAIVNRGPFPVAGGSSAVNANGFSWGDNFGRVRSNPSMRMIIDLADFDRSLAIHPTGQSGHPSHKNYDSMIDLWLNGQYHPFAFSEAAVDATTEQTLTLSPD